jgi:hypothetical protein
MVSILLYGRNDSYGYNLHKRTALGINCMAELLHAPSDEILFVDYNTPDDHPTLPEAIADTLTEAAVRRLRIFRVRPVVHDRIRQRTHLKAVEPIARNVAIRRSDPSNRWVLSTNTDMIFVPRGPARLSEIAADLPDGFYHLPRFELPESLWEGFDRKDPAAVIDQVRAYGRTMFLNEIVYGAECIKYDAPGDFQLMLREDLFRIDGFNEEMLLGWHVDSNIAKRLYLMYGVVGDVVDRLFGYHCDHTRQVTPMHEHKAAANDAARFVDQVTSSTLPAQSRTWGCADEAIEEIRLARSTHHVYVDGLRSVISGELAEPATARYTYDSFDQSDCDTRHVLPFVTDLFTSAPRHWSVAWIGGRRDMFRMFCEMWERLGFGGRVLIDGWSVPLLSDLPACACISDLATIQSEANVIVFDFGAPSQTPGVTEALGLEPGWVDAIVERLAHRSLVGIATHERARMAAGSTPRRFICINAVHNRYGVMVRREIASAATPFATRLRHGFVIPRGPEQLPPEMDLAPDGRFIRTDAVGDVLDRMSADAGGQRIHTGILAPVGRRGYAFRGMPYERLMPGEYELEISVRPRSPFTLAAVVRPLIVEVVAGDRYLAREHMSFFLRGQLRLRFSVPPERREGATGVEFRIFRGRFVDFIVTGVQLWQVPPPLDLTNGSNNAAAQLLLKAFQPPHRGYAV